MVLSFLLRFDFQYDENELSNLLTALPLALPVFLSVIFIFRLYSGIWTYFSFSDCVRYIYALGAGTLFLGALIFAVNGYTFEDFPRSTLIINYLLLLTWEIGGRMGTRFIKEQWVDPSEFPDLKEERVLIIGAHNELDQMMRSLRRAVSNLGRVVGLVSEFSHNQTIRGIRILGPVEEVGEIAWQYDVSLILVLPPYNRPQRLQDIVDRCSKAKVNCKFRQVPSVQDIASGSVGVTGIRNVEIEDLLPRDEFEFDPNVLSEFVGDRVVMVTGGGGSIGAELCRQVLALKPERLIVMDHSEFALFEATREFRTKFPKAKILPITGDVRNPSDVERAVAKAGTRGVDVIYHAAAYKHVHLMEENPVSAVANNVLGTETLAAKAIEHDVEHLVLVSTDKAVRPTSVMGASKRMAERLLLERPRGGTRIVAVRFGNVLGSSGSVIPIFKRQIEKGGPVTVTTPETRRFFMTIPEAVRLLMIAGAVGEDRQILVLEMGEPVRIVDLARRLIELSGYKPDDDIKIEYIGLRPGEKEFEELMTDDEDLVRTSYGKIWTFAKRQNANALLPPLDLDHVRSLVENCDGPALRDLMKKTIPDHRLDFLEIESGRKEQSPETPSAPRKSITDTALMRIRRKGA